MAKLLKGVIQVTGDHDSGKTTFALEAGARPDNILFLDDDLKGRATVDDFAESGIAFGRYVDLIDLAVNRSEYDFHVNVTDLLSKIQPGEFDLIVWDTWTHFASTCHDYVMRHPGDFKKNWSPMGKIKGAQQWQVSRLYEAAIISKMASLAETVILITHLKDYYMGDIKVPGKQIPASSKALDRIMRMRLWLRLNPSGRPVPVGLVLKRLDRKVVEEDKIRTVSVLPRKIVPREDESSLWDSIWRYWEEPFGDREPTIDEVPDEYELSILSSTMTKDQMNVLTSMIEHDLIRVDDDEEGSPDIIAKVWRAYRDKKPLPVIARETGVSPKRAQEIISAMPPEDVTFVEEPDA